MFGEAAERGDTNVSALCKVAEGYPDQPPVSIEFFGYGPYEY
jgi:hypothetical protein